MFRLTDWETNPCDIVKSNKGTKLHSDVQSDGKNEHERLKNIDKFGLCHWKAVTYTHGMDKCSPLGLFSIYFKNVKIIKVFFNILLNVIRVQIQILFKSS